MCSFGFANVVRLLNLVQQTVDNVVEGQAWHSLRHLPRDTAYFPALGVMKKQSVKFR